MKSTLHNGYVRMGVSEDEMATQHTTHHTPVQIADPATFTYGSLSRLKREVEAGCRRFWEKRGGYTPSHH